MSEQNVVGFVSTMGETKRIDLILTLLAFLCTNSARGGAHAIQRGLNG
jgi:hypothetical protein